MLLSDLMYKLDMGWSKRSSGRRYDSQSGHGVLIGQSSKKIIDFVLYTKSCRICAHAVGKAIERRQHEYTINWTKSSKSRECEGIVLLCCEALKKTSFKLITDDDTNMRAQLQHKGLGTKGKLPVSLKKNLFQNGGI